MFPVMSYRNAPEYNIRLLIITIKTVSNGMTVIFLKICCSLDCEITDIIEHKKDI